MFKERPRPAGVAFEILQKLIGGAPAIAFFIIESPGKFLKLLVACR